MIIAVVIASIAADQLVKFLFSQFLPDYVVVTPQTLFLSNTAAGAVSLVFIVLLLGLYLRDRQLIHSNLWATLGVGFCFGGALSNIIDRIGRGGVLDFGVAAVRSNLADLLVLAGLIFLFWFYLSRRSLEE